jgi:hypothetical protein
MTIACGGISEEIDNLSLLRTNLVDYLLIYEIIETAERRDTTHSTES